MIRNLAIIIAYLAWWLVKRATAEIWVCRLSLDEMNLSSFGLESLF